MVGKNKTNIKDASVDIKIVSLKDLNIEQKNARFKASSFAFAVCMRSLLNQWRQGTVACLDRTEVNRTGRKPWRQKGTGRARAGTSRSPLWRGGGVTHGPQMRVRKTGVNKKMRVGVFAALCKEYVTTGNVLSIDWKLENNIPRTKAASQVLVAAQAYGKKVIVFLSPDDHVHYASFANLKNVQPIFFDQPNVFHLSNARKWIFLQKDMEQFKRMVSTWL